MKTAAPRVALWHANYRGDATGAVGEVVGVSPFGESLVVVDAERRDDGRTRLGFALATKTDVQDLFDRFDATFESTVVAHPAFFGGPQ